MAATIEKRCVLCSKDISQERRTKDAAGRYYCDPCYSAALARTASVPAARQQPASERMIPVNTPYAAVPSTHPVLAGAGSPAPTQPNAAASRAAAATPQNRVTRSVTVWQIIWITVFGVPTVVGDAVFIAGSSIFTPIIGTSGLYVLSGLSFFCGIGLCRVLGTIAWRSGPTAHRVIAAAAILVLVMTAWLSGQHVSELYSSMPTKPVPFAEIDGKFGFTAIANPQQLTKTSDQLQQEMQGYLGAGVKWKGLVIDVRGDQILIEMRQISLTNEVALICGWWEPAKTDIKRGDLIEFTGVIGGFGNPYPYAVTNGTVISARSATDEEVKAALPQ